VGEVLQTIGIVFMTLGSILAIEGLWRQRLKNSIKKTQRLVDAYEKALDKIENLTKEHYKRVLERHPNLAELHETSNHKYDFIISIMVYFGLLWKTAKVFVRYRALIFLRKHLVHIGILFIIFGAGTQIFAVNF